MQLTMQPALALTTVCGLALGGCSSSNTAISPEVDPLNFACDDGANIEATFPTEPDGEVTVSLPDQAEDVTLSRVATASGAKYSDGTTTFWEKGGEALVEVEGKMKSCTME